MIIFSLKYGLQFLIAEKSNDSLGLISSFRSILPTLKQIIYSFELIEKFNIIRVFTLKIRLQPLTN